MGSISGSIPFLVSKRGHAETSDLAASGGVPARRRSRKAGTDQSTTIIDRGCGNSRRRFRFGRRGRGTKRKARSERRMLSYSFSLMAMHQPRSAHRSSAVLGESYRLRGDPTNGRHSSAQPSHLSGGAFGDLLNVLGSESRAKWIGCATRQRRRGILREREMLRALAGRK